MLGVRLLVTHGVVRRQVEDIAEGGALWVLGGGLDGDPVGGGVGVALRVEEMRHHLPVWSGDRISTAWSHGGGYCVSTGEVKGGRPEAHERGS